MRVMKTPQSIDIDITNRCNLRCPYCFHFSSPGDVSQDLPGEEWLTFFEELNRCAVMEVCLAGGEPFCREDLKELIGGIVRNRMRFSILSNGTRINEEMAAFLAATRRCSYVQVSIDGSIPITHDSFRGEGTFFQAMKGIESLQRQRVPVAVRVTIHKKNVGDLEGIARLLLEEIGLPDFSTNSAGYMGLCRKNSEQVQLSPQERSFAMEILLKLNQKYNGRINAAAGPLAEAREWLEMERAHRKGEKGLPGRGYLTGCGGTMNKMAVRADGVMVPCSQMSHIELGRINQDDLREVWQRHPQLDLLRKRQDFPLSAFEFCKGCDYIPYCTGNCPAMAYNYFGKENYPSPDACLRRFLEAGGRLPLLEEQGSKEKWETISIH